MVTPGEADAACAGSGKRLVTSFDFYMTRAIGDSTVTTSNGALINPATLVSNRVVTKNAELELLIGDFVHQPPGNRPKPPVKKVVISFKVNGHDLPEPLEVSPTPNPGEIRKLKFPVEFLRFPVRDPLSQQPAERPNRVEVYWNTSDFVSPLGWKICGLEGREIELRPRRVRFDAMAPIILIHGNNECAGFFKATGPEGNCSKEKPAVRFDFESALKEARVPYDVSITMATDTVERHAAILDGKIRAILRQFGARRFHVIAHSKGGLDTRELYSAIPRKEPPYAPLSLVTLDTPHLGSPGADYLDAFKEGARIGWDPVTGGRLFLAQIIHWMDPYNGPQWAANLNLTTAAGRAFHYRNLPRLPGRNSTPMIVDAAQQTVEYRAIRADANANGSVAFFTGWPTIEHPENYGLPTGSADANGHISTLLYRLMGETRSVRVERRYVQPPSNYTIPTTQLVAIAEPTTSFMLNDIVVQVESQAPGAPGEPFYWPTTLFNANHASIAKPEVAWRCLELIRLARLLDRSLQ